MHLLNLHLLALLLVVLPTAGMATASFASQDGSIAAKEGDQEASQDLEASHAAYVAGDFEAALNAARRATNALPNQGNVAAARALGAMGAWSPAEAAARAAFTANGNPDNALLLAWTLEGQDQHEPALAVLEGALSAAPTHPVLRREAALLHLETGQPTAALAVLTEPETAEAAVDPGVLGLVLAALQDRQADAAGHLTRALESPASSIVPKQVLQRELGVLLADQGNPAKAAGLLQQAYETGPQTSDLAYRLGLTYRELGQSDDARTMLEEFQRLRASEDANDAAQRSAGAALNEAQELAASNQLDGALNKIDAVLAEHPGSYSAHALRSKVLFSQGKIDGALVSIRAARDLAPGLVEFHYLEGLFARTAGNNGEARRALERALNLNPNLAEAHAILGGILLESGEATNSLKHLDRAIELGAAGEQIKRARQLALERSGA